MTRAVAALLVATMVAVLRAQSDRTTRRGPSDHEALAKAILAQLVEIDTSQSGSTAPAADAVAARLRTAGFPERDIQVLGPVPARVNLVARLRGRRADRKPILLMAHLDVVEARSQDWTVPPFIFIERDGWFYGRGTTDDKDEAAIWTATVIRLRREGFVPDRDIVLLLTADEEVGGDHDGVDWLLRTHRDLIDGVFALNEGGGGVIKSGRRRAHTVQASEKTYVSYELLVTNSGGHSSLPRKDNAITQLASALTRVAAHTFPVRLNEVTRVFFERTAMTETPEIARAMRTVAANRSDAQAEALLSDLPEYDARLRTTCVATRIEGGHADNALPQRARAVINCRLVPGDAPAAIEAALRRLVDDPGVGLRPLWDAQAAPPSPLAAEVLRPIEEITEEMWPGVPVIPTMSTGATDAFYLRRAGIPAYGVSGLFDDVDDIRAHGRDERIRDTWFYEGLEFSYRLLKRLTGG